jgi:asparagine synthase (glutamine-hydrolysing)
MPEFVERALRSVPLSDTGERFQEAYALFDQRMRYALTGRSDGGHSWAAIAGWLDWCRGAAENGADLMMRIDARLQLADDLLLYGDKISMAHSLEARVPMLDLDLIRLVESFPLKYRTRIGKTKIVHKRVAAELLPQAIVNRAKKGFELPFAVWARGVWRDRVRDVLLDPAGAHFRILSRQTVEHLWVAFDQGRDNLSRQMFALVALALWFNGLKASGVNKVSSGTGIETSRSTCA